MYFIIAGVVFLFFVYQSVTFRKNERLKLLNKIKNNWGSVPDREYEYDEFQKITKYYQSVAGSAFHIDDITWNDLAMDDIFMLLNNTYSSAGEEYLYKMLRIPSFDSSELKHREKLIRYFEENSNEAFLLQERFSALGRTKSISLSQFLHRLEDLGNRSNGKHYVMDILFAASAGLLFFQPVAGLVLFLLMLSVNIISYYREKAEIESYFICFKYLVDMINCAEAVNKLNIRGIDEYTSVLKDCLAQLQTVRNGIFLLSMNGTGGSLGEIIMEYFRMIFHVDIIKFNSMLDSTRKNIGYIDTMFETLGRLEAGMAVASFRTALPYYCRPELYKSGKNTRHLDVTEIYHPMISNPVANNLYEEKSVLITGSNASGKSTFLKTIAINAILAQTVYTCTAKNYVSCFFRIYSSMALKDNLLNNESYYIVEIKSLKRIIDAIDDRVPVLCFVDEVLRGTNTIERIAASSHILKYLSRQNVMCFAATHDIELTHMLVDDYSNYHFTENVQKNDIQFSYELLKGRATSRNAIQLLNIIGFEKSIVKNADELAHKFMEQGVWEKL